MAMNSLYVRLLGGLELRSPFGIVSREDFSSLQCCTLFVYLVSNRHRVIPIREIAEILRPDELIENPYNLVKSAVFRTRKALEGVGIEPLIVSSGGTYAISADLEIILDVDEFERSCKCAAVKTINRTERLSHYQRAFKLYKGGMLPNMEADMWLLTKINYYQILYINMVMEYIRLLGEAGEYTCMFEIAAKALQTEMIGGEIHGMLIDALINNSLKDMARRYFRQAEQFLSPEYKDAIRQRLEEPS